MGVVIRARGSGISRLDPTVRILRQRALGILIRECTYTHMSVLCSVYSDTHYTGSSDNDMKTLVDLL